MRSRLFITIEDEIIEGLTCILAALRVMGNEDRWKWLVLEVLKGIIRNEGVTVII